MLLASESRDFLELTITGYEFGAPGSVPVDEWDRNWLNVSGRIGVGEESWGFVEPCLTTWEAHRLAGWLQLAIHSQPEPLQFTEPNLEFRTGPSSEGHRDIVVVLRAESAPPPLSRVERWDGGYTLTLQIAPDALAESARAWRDDVAAHPER